MAMAMAMAMATAADGARQTNEDCWSETGSRQRKGENAMYVPLA
jgi:hypothetical protein